MRKILFFIPLFLWTCGGGGSSPTEPELPQLPTVTNIAVTTLEDTPTTFAFTGTDPLNSALSYSVSTQPQHGAISISGGAGTYTPNANYNGQDVIAYIATSINGNSNIGTIIITITPVDDEPNTMDVTATTDEDNAVTMTLEAEEVDGQTIQFNVTGNPSNGSVSISGTTATYTPNQDWFGTDIFNFEVVDSNSRKILNTATGTVIVNPINDSPVLKSIEKEYTASGESIDIVLTATDIENDNLTYFIVDTPNGNATVSGNTITYQNTSMGSDSFTVKANDGTDDSNIITIPITVYSYHGNEEQSWSIIEDSNGDYMFSGKRSLFRTSPDGNQIWSKEYNINNPGDQNDQLRVRQTADGGFILVGRANKGSSSSGVSWDARIIKTDSSGNEEWSRDFNTVETNGDNANDYGQDVQQATDGGYFVLWNQSGGDAGFLSKIDASRNEQWRYIFEETSNTINVKSLASTNDGGCIVSFDLSAGEARLRKLNSSGSLEWEYSTPTQGRMIFKVRQTSDGGYITSGYTSSNNLDLQILKFSSGGDLEWSHTRSPSNSNASEIGHDIQETIDGGYISTGGVNEVIVFKIDSSGNYEWENIFNHSTNHAAYGEAIQQKTNNNYIISGSINFSGNKNILLLEIDSEGNRIF